MLFYWLFQHVSVKRFWFDFVSLSEPSSVVRFFKFSLVKSSKFPFFVIVLCLLLFHPWRPMAGGSQSVGSGEKAGGTFSITGERVPGYRLSPNYFQKFKRTPAPDWAQKMLCTIVPNGRTVSPEFFS